MQETKFQFNKVKERIERLKANLPPILANQAKSYFLKSWDEQGWEGQKWQEVQRRIPGTAAYRYPKKWGLSRRTQPILIGAGRVKGSSGGALRRAVSASVRAQSIHLIRLVVDLPYAAIHNDGGAGTAFGKHKFTMPKRTFMKDSATLRRIQLAKINQYLNKVWQG